MAINNPLAALIQSLSSRKKVDPIKQEEKVSQRHGEVLSRLKSMQDWQKTANMKFRVLTTTVQRIDSVQAEELEEKKENKDSADIKKLLEKINARLAPRIFNLKEEGDFQYDPLAPQGKQVTKLSRQGKAVVGATNKDIEVVLKKAAYIFNQEIEKQQEKKLTKVEARTKKKKPAITAKMAKVSNAPSTPGKKDFTEVYKRLAYEKEEDDPVFLLTKNVEKNFKQVFKELKTLRALIINSSGGGLNPLDLLGRGGGRGGRGGPGGRGGSPRGGSGGRFRGLGGVAGTLAIGGGLGIYNAIREADPNRTSGDVAEQMAVNGAVGGYLGYRAVKSTKQLIKKSKAVSRLSKMRKVNPEALKGTVNQSRKWTRFMKWLAKRSPKLFAKVGTRMASMGALSTIPVWGWIADVGLAAWTAYDVYDLWQEYNTLSDQERQAEESGTATAAADSVQAAQQNKSSPSPSSWGTAAAMGAKSIQADQQRATRTAAIAAGAYGTSAATTEELKGVNDSGSAKQALSFFQHKGWTREQSAGIVGNLLAESGTSLKTNVMGDGGKAYGLAQWHADRQEIFKKTYNKSIQQANFEEQLEFVNWELNNTEKSAGEALRQAKTATDAAAIVDSLYERSSGQHRQKRIDYANQLLDSKYVEKVSAGGQRATSSAPSTPVQNPAGTTRGIIDRSKPGTAGAGDAAAAPSPARVTADTAIAEAQQEVARINKGYETSVGALQTALTEGRITKEQFQTEVTKLDEARRAAIKEPSARASALAQAKQAITGTAATAAPETKIAAEKPLATQPAADVISETTNNENIVTATTLPREEADYALKQLGMLNDPEKPVTPIATTAPAAPQTTTTQVTTNTLKIANEPVVPGQRLSKKQMAAIDIATSMGNTNTYPPEVMAQYNAQKTGKVATPVTPVASTTAPVSAETQLPDEPKTSGAQKILESSIVRNLIGSEKSSKIVSVVKAAESLKRFFTPTQERASGDKLSEDSSTFESNKMAAAIQPVVLNNMVQQGGGSCRFVPTPPAPMPPVDIKNADASIKSAFNRDRWA